MQCLYQLKFTHCAACKRSNEVTGDASANPQLEKQILAELQQKYKKVFIQLVFPAVLDKTQLHEHRTRLKDEYIDLPHHKIDPLDSQKLDKLKKTLITWLDSNWIILFDGFYSGHILFSQKKNGEL